MDNQDHRKNHTPGHDGHGVHVCNNCGWPFPNPHPSARHRRAHKKICGTIEGYKLVDSDTSTHLTVSDDEHLSDEDHKTPGAQILERSNNEKGSAETGERLARSEDEVFSDTITEFSDSGSGRWIGESPDEIKKASIHLETILESHTVTTLSYEDDPMTATISPSSNSADKSQLQSTEVRGKNLSGSAQESNDHVSNSTVDFMEISLTDYRTEEPAYESNDDKRGSTCDLNPIQLEFQTDELQKNDEKTATENKAETDEKGNKETRTKRIDAGDDLTETDVNANEGKHLDRRLLDVEALLSDDVGEAAVSKLGNVEDITSGPAPAAGLHLKEQHNDMNADEEKHLDRSQLDVEVLHSDDASEAAVSKLGNVEDITSGPAPVAGLNQLKKQDSDELDSKISLNGLSLEVQPVEHTNTSVVTAQINVDATEGMISSSSGKSIEMFSGKEEGNDNVHVLSIPDDIPIVDNAERMIKGFKDHKGGRLPQLVDVDSFEVINDAKDFVLKGNPDNLSSDLSSEGTEVSASNKQVLKDNIEQKDGSNDHSVEDFPDETKPGLSQVKVTMNESQQTEEIGVLTDTAATEIGKSSTVQCSDEILPKESYNNLSQANSAELSVVDPVAAPMNSEVRQTMNLVGVDDAGDYEKSGIKSGGVDNEDKRNREESWSENMIATSEPLNILSEPKVDAWTDSFGYKNAADHKEDKVKSCHISETETGDGNSTLHSLEENPPVKTAMMAESANNIQESHVISENIINASERNLSEHECMHLSSISGNQEGVKELERNGYENGKVQVEGADKFSAVAKSIFIEDNDKLQKSSDNVGDLEVLQNPTDKTDCVEVLKKSSEENMTKEPQLSPLDMSSIQNCVTVGDNPAIDFIEVASQSGSSPDECENKFAAQLLGASATDFSVDSGSQTDSLEGHWGSVSVLSTQSDMPTIVDTESLALSGSKASAEGDKSNLKKPKALLREQNSDESDCFEPPSFMTLVEPGLEDKPAASEIHTVQKLQQEKDASLQAGWFPSLNLGVNESEERRKNEERIAKVTNRSTGKKHTPLKNLLGEATIETKSKSPNAKENPPPPVIVQKEETSAKDNGSSATTLNSTLGPQMPGAAVPAKKEAGKEWNSPPRYPADIKREKRKIKGRPYWAQFICCSSVN